MPEVIGQKAGAFESHHSDHLFDLLMHLHCSPNKSIFLPLWLTYFILFSITLFYVLSWDFKHKGNSVSLEIKSERQQRDIFLPCRYLSLFWQEDNIWSKLQCSSLSSPSFHPSIYLSFHPFIHLPIHQDFPPLASFFKIFFLPLFSIQRAWDAARLCKTVRRHFNHSCWRRGWPFHFHQLSSNRPADPRFRGQGWKRKVVKGTSLV